jgi:hypothetical protein
METETDEATANNIIAEHKIIKAVYKETKYASMCCFQQYSKQKSSATSTEPLDRAQFKEKCKVSQAPNQESAGQFKYGFTKFS